MAICRGLVFVAVILFSVTRYATSEYESDNFGKEHNLTEQNATESSSGEDILESMNLLGFDVEHNQTEVTVSARMKMSDFMLNPVMLVPQLIMWGFAPILLANLKMFVMQALMLNKMALSSAIFMTLRNIVFGPRPGPIVKYANYGYGNEHNKVYHYHRN